MARRGFHLAAGALAAVPLASQAATQARQGRKGRAAPASAGAIGRRNLGKLEVSSIGLGVQNMRTSCHCLS
ncbi:hypothetical protein FCL38_00705 [Pseudoduganella umbonata]|uniref:Twin-arginine translocation signal domain-containing protein n=1 Tax=Pseudoduganella umbonata TaxID=864828 RepID=A0ABX5UBE9_9BURK|nr:hypothetical protein FCL38_00705 [Pseudoduganella umbonata]